MCMINCVCAFGGRVEENRRKREKKEKDEKRKK